jgi:hypothetical protein
MLLRLAGILGFLCAFVVHVSKQTHLHRPWVLILAFYACLEPARASLVPDATLSQQSWQ